MTVVAFTRPPSCLSDEAAEVWRDTAPAISPLDKKAYDLLTEYSQRVVASRFLSCAISELPKGATVAETTALVDMQNKQTHRIIELAEALDLFDRIGCPA